MTAIFDGIGRAGEKRYRLIACEIAYRELCLCVAQARAVVDLDFLRKGLHDIETGRMRAAIQERIDVCDGELYAAVLLGYGLCNNGVVGLVARDVPIVIPRGHDCITFFMGSKERYRAYFDSHPGTFYLTSGWCERDFADDEEGVTVQLGINRTYEEYVEQYGEENARFIMESLGGWEKSYSRVTYIEMGLDGGSRYEQEARAGAEENGWEFERIEGKWGLLKNLAGGAWDDEAFLVVPPGCRIEATGDETIFRAVPVEEIESNE